MENLPQDLSLSSLLLSGVQQTFLQHKHNLRQQTDRELLLLTTYFNLL